MFAIIQTRRASGQGDPGLRASPLTASTPRSARKSRFDQVLFLEKDGGEMLAGAPFVANARVVGVVDGESRGPKIRRLQEEAPQGLPQDARPPQHLHARPRHRHRWSRHAELKINHGYKKRAGQFTQRPRQQLAAPRRQAPRRQRRDRRLDSRPAARPQVPARPERRPRQGRHAVRQGRRDGEVRGSRRPRPHDQRHPLPLESRVVRQRVPTGRAAAALARLLSCS